MFHFILFYLLKMGSKMHSHLPPSKVTTCRSSRKLGERCIGTRYPFTTGDLLPGNMVVDFCGFVEIRTDFQHWWSLTSTKVALKSSWGWNGCSYQIWLQTDYRRRKELGTHTLSHISPIYILLIKIRDSTFYVLRQWMEPSPLQKGFLSLGSFLTIS